MTAEFQVLAFEFHVKSVFWTTQTDYILERIGFTCSFGLCDQNQQIAADSIWCDHQTFLLTFARCIRFIILIQTKCYLRMPKRILSLTNPIYFSLPVPLFLSSCFQDVPSHTQQQNSINQQWVPKFSDLQQYPLMTRILPKMENQESAAIFSLIFQEIPAKISIKPSFEISLANPL